MTKKVTPYEYYQEKMICLSDINRKFISNDRAKHILGKFFRIPRELQAVFINQMVHQGLLKGIGQRELEIIASS